MKKGFPGTGLGLWLALALLGGALAHGAHRQADARRHEVDVDMALLYLPNGPTLKLASLGFHEPLADLLWFRTVLLFGERWGTDPNGSWGPWVRGMVEAVVHLDPSWRTPYFYGGMFLRVMEDADGSDAIFRAAIDAIPHDAFFPFALGMNAFLLRKDTAEAARWLAVAARRPNAPPWYAAAAASFLSDANQRATAIRFLEEERASTTDPDIQKTLDTKLQELRHDEWADRLEQARTTYKERQGVDIQSVDDLARAGLPIPPDPYEARWILAPDGRIRSSAREAQLLEKARAQEREWLLRR